MCNLLILLLVCMHIVSGLLALVLLSNKLHDARKCAYTGKI